MTSLKYFAAVLVYEPQYCAQNKPDMSVTPPVAHREMWPYVASAAARSESHAATAVLIVVSSATSGVTVGAGVIVGTAVVGAGVGQPPCVTPHDVDAHGV